MMSRAGKSSFNRSIGSLGRGRSHAVGYDTSRLSAGGRRPSANSRSFVGGTQPHLNRSKGLREINLVSAHANSSGYNHPGSSTSYHERVRRKGQLRHLLILAIAIVIALVIAGIVSSRIYVASVDRQLSDGLGGGTALSAQLAAPTSSTAPFWMLLEGTDGDIGGSGDADAIVLVRVDPSQKQAWVISVPADLYVSLSEAGGTGSGSICTSHALGGASGSLKAVAALTGVSFSHYVEVNGAGFTGLVDAFGGVAVDLAESVPAVDAEGAPLYNLDGSSASGLDAGKQALDGTDALILCRSRAFAIGEYQRTANQRVFVQAFTQKVLTTGPDSLFAVANSVAPYVSTDLTSQQIADLAKALKGISISNIHSYVLPTETGTRGGKSVKLIDQSGWADMLAAIDSGNVPDGQDEDVGGTVAEEYAAPVVSTQATIDTSQYTVAIRNGGGVAGSATSVSSTLTAAGYHISETGNTSMQVYEETFVIYNTDADIPAAQDIIKRLGQGKLVQSAGRYSFDGNVLVVTGADWK